jgi:glutamyl-tRNA synthetase
MYSILLGNMQPARTRFAPSPTGFLHAGNVRSALFPWLVARHSNGTFILRIEDTDQAREVPGAVEVIEDTLHWLGITWDEGLSQGGEFGPYTQSERRERYVEWAQRLVDMGRAYADTRTSQALDVLREGAKAQKKPFLARDYRPTETPEWKLGMPLRFLSDPKAYTWYDAVMGELKSGSESIDDFILLKSDGLPTYNFAHIVDDFDMHITHVIRGIEYISSVPKYLNLYEALNISVPILAHVPHIMRPDGRKKLGKRDGAQSILEYRTQGYLPEAMLNFLASMGWNDGTEQEIFSRDELIEKFSLDHVQKSGALFDERRLQWLNGAWIRRLPLDDLFTRCQSYWPSTAAEFDDNYKRRVLGLLQERLKYLAEIPALSAFFFVDLPINPELITTHKQLKKYERTTLQTLLNTALTSLQQSNFELPDLSDRLNELLATTGEKPAVLFSLIRIATTQAAASPSLAESLAVLGKTRVLMRLKSQLDGLE